MGTYRYVNIGTKLFTEPMLTYYRLGTMVFAWSEGNSASYISTINHNYQLKWLTI